MFIEFKFSFIFLILILLMTFLTININVTLGLNISFESIKSEPGEPVDIIEESVDVVDMEDGSDGEERSGDTETLRKTRFLENMITDTGARYSDLDNLCIFFDEKTSTMGKKCLLNLGKIDIDIVVDEVLTENFCDQEGRLVCLICYKIMGQNEFQVGLSFSTVPSSKTRN